MNEWDCISFENETGNSCPFVYLQKTAVELENSIITSNEREEIRKKLVIREGINVDAIKTIRGNFELVR